MKERKAQLFFTTDTFLAIVILVGTFLLVQSSFTSESQGEDPQQAMVELNSFLTETTVNELQESYPGVYDNPPNFDPQSDAWRRQLSVYQELNYLDNNGYEAEAETLLERLAELIISERFNYRFTVNGDVLIEDINTPVSESPAYVTKRSLIYSPTNQGGDIIGPNTTKVDLWL